MAALPESEHPLHGLALLLILIHESKHPLYGLALAQEGYWRPPTLSQSSASSILKICPHKSS